MAEQKKMEEEPVLKGENGFLLTPRGMVRIQKIENIRIKSAGYDDDDKKIYDIVCNMTDDSSCFGLYDDLSKKMCNSLMTRLFTIMTEEQKEKTILEKQEKTIQKETVVEDKKETIVEDKKETIVEDKKETVVEDKKDPNAVVPGKLKTPLGIFLIEKGIKQIYTEGSEHCFHKCKELFVYIKLWDESDSTLIYKSDDIKDIEKFMQNIYPQVVPYMI